MTNESFIKVNNKLVLVNGHPITINGSSSNLQENKAVTITANGTITVTPDESYDGLSSVDVTVDVAGSGDVETCTVTFSSNIPDIAGHVYDKIFLTVFENYEITTKTVSYVNNITVPNVVLNSVGMVIYTTRPNSISITNATKLSADLHMAFTFTGNASIASTFDSGGGGGAT